VVEKTCKSCANGKKTLEERLGKLKQEKEAEKEAKKAKKAK